MDTKRFLLGFVAVMGMSTAATPVFGQLCLGVPLDGGQTSLALTFDMPDGANIVGAEVNRQMAGPLIVGANAGATLYDSEALDTDINVGGRVGFALAAGGMSGIGICPVAGVNATFGNDRTSLQVPLGAGLGAAFEVQDGIAVAPFVVPQFVWSRFDASGEGDAVTDTGFELSGGANLIVSNLFFGARVQRMLEDNAETLFGVQAGIIF